MNRPIAGFGAAGTVGGRLMPGRVRNGVFCPKNHPFLRLVTPLPQFSAKLLQQKNIMFYPLTCD
jgi:hypothetical protein